LFVNSKIDDNPSLNIASTILSIIVILISIIYLVSVLMQGVLFITLTFAVITISLLFISHLRNNEIVNDGTRWIKLIFVILFIFTVAIVIIDISATSVQFNSTIYNQLEYNSSSDLYVLGSVSINKNSILPVTEFPPRKNFRGCLTGVNLTEVTDESDLDIDIVNSVREDFYIDYDYRRYNNDNFYSSKKYDLNLPKQIEIIISESEYTHEDVKITKNNVCPKESEEPRITIVDY